MDLASASHFATELLQITRNAQEAFHTSDFTVNRKADSSPVTQIDLVTEVQIISLCRSVFGADVVIIAEESGYSEESAHSASPWTVYIDPIDGTIPLCAGDISMSNIAVGIFFNDQPHIGFIGRLSDEGVLLGGSVLGDIYDMKSDGTVSAMRRCEIATQNKMWCFDIGQYNWSDPLHGGILRNLFADPKTLGYNHYVLPSVASGLKVLYGNARFFIGGKSSRPWDVAAVMPMLEVLNYQIVELADGQPLKLGRTIDNLPSFVMADSAETIEYVLSHRPK